MNLRERCSEYIKNRILIGTIVYDPECGHCVGMVDNLEAFAREIRNEALEDAANEVDKDYTTESRKYALRLRALKQSVPSSAQIQEDK